VEEETALEIVELRRKGLGCLLAVFLVPIAVLFGWAGLFYLLDPRLWIFGVLMLFVPLASAGYMFWTPIGYRIGAEGVAVRYGLGRTRTFDYGDMAEVRLRGNDTAFFRLRGRLANMIRASEYEGDFNAAVRHLLVAARDHGIPVKVDPRRSLRIGTRKQAQRDLAEWEEQVGMRPQIPRAVARKKKPR
jgi:hypothetical protein